MRVELLVTIRGDERRVRWADGDLRGDEEIIRRLERVVAEGQVDQTDLLSVVRGVELVTAQQVELVNLDLVEPLDTTFLGEPVRPPFTGSPN